MIIEIVKELVPYTFELESNGKIIALTTRYNEEHDFYTFDASVDGVDVIDGEKVLYGKTLFQDHQHLNIPLNVMPIDIADASERAGQSELGETVFLWVVDDEV